MACAKTKRLLDYLLSGGLTALLVVLTLAVRKGFILSPAKNGFFCGDRSISYPVKEETVNTNMLIAIGSLAVLAVAVASELLKPNSSISSKQKITKFAWMLKPLKTFFLFLIGFAVNVLLFELGKIKTGVLRPNFLSACVPNVTCSPGDVTTYVENFSCTLADEEEEDDARKSFPSGHAAVVSYMALFICLFLKRRPWTLPNSVMLLRPAVQVACVSVAWMTSLSRVSDHVHHVSDVVVGIILGCAVAFWAEGLAWQEEEQQQEESVGSPSAKVESEENVCLKRKGEEEGTSHTVGNGLKTQL